MNANKHNAVAAGALLVAGIFAAGCSTSAWQRDYSAWQGHSSGELLDSWGEPDTIEELGADYLAYTWLGDDGLCRRTFTARTGTITGYSETDC
jgi:hypothetical protein